MKDTIEDVFIFLLKEINDKSETISHRETIKEKITDSEAESLLSIIKRRLAQGEISLEEYEKLKKELL